MMSSLFPRLVNVTLINRFICLEAVHLKEITDRMEMLVLPPVEKLSTGQLHVFIKGFPYIYFLNLNLRYFIKIWRYVYASYHFMGISQISLWQAWKHWIVNFLIFVDILEYCLSVLVFPEENSTRDTYVSFVHIVWFQLYWKRWGVWYSGCNANQSS